MVARWGVEGMGAVEGTGEKVERIKKYKLEVTEIITGM